MSDLAYQFLMNPLGWWIATGIVSTPILLWVAHTAPMSDEGPITADDSDHYLACATCHRDYPQWAIHNGQCGTCRGGRQWL